MKVLVLRLPTDPDYEDKKYVVLPKYEGCQIVVYADEVYVNKEELDSEEEVNEFDATTIIVKKEDHSIEVLIDTYGVHE